MQKKKLIPSIFDPIFKAILTDKKLKDYLSYLISEITDLDYDYVYDNLSIVNGELQIEYWNQKLYRTDLLIEIEKNKINIEANREKSEGNIIKNEKYHHKLASDTKTGNSYESTKIYQINFNEYNRFKKKSNIVDKVMLVNIDTGEIEEEEYQRYHINLAKLKKKYYNKEKLTLFERRCLILVLTNEEEIKEIIKQDEMMERVFDKMKELNENKNIMDLWDEEKEKERARNYDMKIAKEKAEKKGFESGEKKGMQQGLKQGLEQTAHNMKKENIALDVIQKVTGLNIEKIERL